MIDVIGQLIGNARAALETAGFPTIDVKEAASKTPEGTVVGQDPAAGVRVGKGSLVTLYVSAPKGSPGPTPSPSPSPSHSPSHSPSPSPSPSSTKKK
jgi:beta-lactam-binding protein with PASTA domain